MYNEIKKFLFALQFLTIINLKFIEWNTKFAAKSVIYFPIVGILIGGILAIIYLILSFFLPTTIIAIIIIILEVVLTRGLHLDGFIDTIDGLFGGINKDERLQIMKDPHPGSFGIIAVVLLLLLKFTLIFEILQNKFFVIEILILMPALGRYVILIPMTIFPYARNNGIGYFTKFVKKREILIATLFMLSFIILIAFLNPLFLPLLLLLIALVSFSLVLSKYIASKIGGMTGDAYGTLIEISEIFVLLYFIVIHITQYN